MGLGDMVGKAAGMLGGGDGGGDDLMGKLGEMGINPTELVGLDADGITGMLESKGIDLSMLEGLGISVEDILAKITGA